MVSVEAALRSNHPPKRQVRALALDFQCEVTGAGSYVQKLVRIPCADALADDLAPPDVHAAAQDMVGQHIAIRDSGECFANKDVCSSCSMFCVAILADYPLTPNYEDTQI